MKLTPTMKNVLSNMVKGDMEDPRPRSRRTYEALQTHGLIRWLPRKKVWRITAEGMKAAA